MSSLNIDLFYIIPELIITSALLLIVVADLISDKTRRLIPFIACVSIFSASLAVLSQSGFNVTPFEDSKLFVRPFELLTVDPAGNFFKLVILIASLFMIRISTVSLEIKNSITGIGEYYTLLFGMILGMMLMTSSTNMIMLYISIELLSLSSYILAGYSKNIKRSSEASLKYLIYGAVSSGIMLYGISILFGLTGTLDMYQINVYLSTQKFDVFALSLSLIFITVGIGYKIAAVPFHYWTPDIYEGAPISITAYLSTASKTAGFAILFRFIQSTFVTFSDNNGNWETLTSFDWSSLVILLSVLSMVVGNFTALWQSNLKRLLAYSSIAHAGYMLLGFTVLSNMGITAVFLYLLFYVLMNMGAFYVVMLVANKTNSEELESFSGLGSKNLFLFLAFAVFLISLVGLPPTAGFIGKFYIFIALLDKGMISLAVIALLNTVVSLYYYVKILKYIYINPAKNDAEPIKLVTGDYVFLLAATLPLLFFGIYYSPAVSFVNSFISNYIN